SDAVHHGDAAVLPPVQTVVGRDPDTTVFGPNDRHAFAAGQSLPGGKVGNGILTEPVDAVTSDGPNIAFPILKKSGHGVAGETVSLGKDVRFALMDVNQPAVWYGDPQPSVTISEDLRRLQMLRQDGSGTAVHVRS